MQTIWHLPDVLIQILDFSQNLVIFLGKVSINGMIYDVHIFLDFQLRLKYILGNLFHLSQCYYKIMFVRLKAMLNLVGYIVDRLHLEIVMETISYAVQVLIAHDRSDISL